MFRKRARDEDLAKLVDEREKLRARHVLQHQNVLQVMAAVEVTTQAARRKNMRKKAHTTKSTQADSQ